MYSDIISIIVPVYGVETYLEECVDSILNQTYTDIEVILVDDGSKDNCPAICDVYAEKDSRVKVIHQSNGGVISARKAGAHAAAGEYIINVDGDDYITDDLVENIHNIILLHKPEVITYGFERFEQESRTIFYSSKLDSESFLDKEGINRIRQSYMFNIAEKNLNGGSLLYSMCTKAIRRDLYIACLDAVPDNITNGEDTLFTMKLLMECKSMYISTIKGYMYRCRNGSAVKSITDKDFLMLEQLLAEFRKVQGSYKDMDNQIAAYIITRINALVMNALENGMTYKKFRKYIEGSHKILDEEPVRYGVRLKRGSYKDSFLVYLIIHKMWLILFMYKKIKRCC